MNTSLSTLAASFAGLLAAQMLSLPAQAQSVHKCKIDGRPVYQSSPCPLEARVAPAAPPASAEPSAAPKKRTLADLLRERDGADRTRPPATVFQGDGASVLRSRMGAV